MDEEEAEAEEEEEVWGEEEQEKDSARCEAADCSMDRSSASVASTFPLRFFK